MNQATQEGVKGWLSATFHCAYSQNHSCSTCLQHLIPGAAWPIMPHQVQSPQLHKLYTLPDVPSVPQAICKNQTAWQLPDRNTLRYFAAVLAR